MHTRQCRSLPPGCFSFLVCSGVSCSERRRPKRGTSYCTVVCGWLVDQRNNLLAPA